MTKIEELLSNFNASQPSEQASDFFCTKSQKPDATPEEKDFQRLENDIQSGFENRKLLNKIIFCLVSVCTSNAGMHIFARIGIPAIAGGTLGGIAVVVLLGNALTKIQINQGKPQVSSDFFLGLAQATGAAGAMWLGASEYREVSALGSQGKRELLVEVKDFNIKPHPPDMGRLGLLGIGVCLLIVAIGLLRGKNHHGF
jgi:hypothetical protein